MSGLTQAWMKSAFVWRSDDGRKTDETGEATPPTPELSVPVKASTCSPKPPDFHGGADFRGAGRTTSSLTGCFGEHGAIPPQAFFSWPSSTLRLNCIAEKSLQLWLLLEKWKLHTLGMMGLTQVLLWLEWVTLAKTWPQSPSSEPEWLLPFLHWTSGQGLRAQQLSGNSNYALGKRVAQWLTVTFSTVSQSDVANWCHRSSPRCSSSPAHVSEAGILPHLTGTRILCVVVT